MTWATTGILRAASARTAGSDGKPRYIGAGKGGFVCFPQTLYGGVGIGERLKIGDINGIGPLGGSLRPPAGDLLRYGARRVFGKIPGTARAAKQAAACAKCTVTVRAGEAAVKRDFGGFPAKQCAVIFI